jgi:hypothetical protein
MSGGISSGKLHNKLRNISHFEGNQNSKYIIYIFYKTFYAKNLKNVRLKRRAFSLEKS